VKGKGGETRKEGKVKESKGETRWREGYDQSKNFGMSPPMRDRDGERHSGHGGPGPADGIERARASWLTVVVGPAA